MKQVRCIIVDDEPLAIQVIKKHVEQMPQLELVATFQNPLQAFELIQKEEIDLVFLDIHMPVLTGLDFVKALKKAPSIIFTTAYRNYAVESYELDVIDYLVKPIPFTRFFKAVNKFLNQLTSKTVDDNPNPTPPHQQISSPANQQTNQIYVNANKKQFKVEFENILYVESIKDYVRIHTTGKNVVTKDKISDFEKKLPSYFLRVHRSFIVNTKKISAFTAHDIEIGEMEIPIGGNYKEVVKEKLKG